MSEKIRFEDAFDKYARIVLELHKHGISLIDAEDGDPVLRDEANDVEFMQSLVVWQTMEFEDVISSAVLFRDTLVNKKKIRMN